MKIFPRGITALCVALAATTVASATPYLWNSSGANLDWSDTANWLPTGLPGASDSVTFGNADQSGSLGAADNIVDENFTVDSLWYAATNISPAFMYHNTEINSGVTLSVVNTNAVIVFDSGTQTDPAVTPPGKTASYSSIFGGGSLVVNDTNSASVMIVSQGSSTYSGASGLWAQLDMSGLNAFTGTFGRLLVGVQGQGASTLAASGRQSGILSLAVTNNIHLTQTGNIQGSGSASIAGPALVINDSPFFGDNGSSLFLGQSNAIWADTITVGRIQCSRTALFEFNPNTSFAPAQQLFLRGQSSNRVSEVIVGDDTANGGTCNAPPGSGIVVPPGGFQVGAAGLFDVSQGSSDIMIDTLIIGKGFNGGGGGYAAGIFNMGAGTLDVNTLQLGVMSSASENAPTEGTLNISGGGTVNVNSGPVALGVTVGSPVTTYAAGTLTINSGVLNVANGAYGIADDGLSLSFVGLTNATVTAANIGSVSAPIGNLVTADSTLNLNLNGLQGSVVAVNLTTASQSTGTKININSIAGFVGSQSVVTIIQSDNPISAKGSFTGGVNGSDFVLGSLPAGYQGHLQVTTTAVQLVITQTPVALDAWTGADISIHNTNWSDGHNWSSGSEPDGANPAFFQTAASVGSASQINNIVDGNVATLGLNYVNTGGSFQNTYISNKVTLTLGAGGLTVGSANVDEGDTTGNATISGAGGTLSVNDSGAVIYVGLGHANASSTADATLDMSGLGTFNADAASFLVGVGAVGFASVLQPAGTVYLAQTNDIVVSAGNGDSDSTLVALDVGDAGDAETTAGYGKSVTSELFLGDTNAIFADYIDVGRQFASGKLAFNPAVTNSHPAAYIRGASGGPVSAWNIGDSVENALTAGGPTGVADFTGGSVDAQVGTLNIGVSSSNSVTAASTASGTLTFDAGTIVASTVNVSINPGASYFSPAVGTLNVNGTASLTVNGALNLGVTSGSKSGGTPSATLNINGGAVWADSITAGGNGTVSAINVNGGILAGTNGIGSASAPVGSLNLTNATVAEAAGSAPFISAGSVSLGGTANTIQVLAMPSIEVYPATITVLQSATPIVGSFNLQVSAPPAYAGVQLAESSDHTAVVMTVQSGPVTGRGVVYWVGPTGGDMNWSDGANWHFPPEPAAPDTAFFDNAGQSSNPGLGNADNVVDNSDTIAALWYAATNANATPLYHNTVINSGVTLTVSNSGADIIFDIGTQTDPSAGTTCCYNTISGGGALDVIDTNSESVAICSQGSSTYFYPSSGLWASMDMSGLNTFEGTFGRLLLGVQGVGATPGEVALNGSGRQTGRLSLALTNIIHLTQTGNNQGGASAAAGGPALVILDSGFFGDNGSILTLGQSNALWADTITVGRNGALQSGVIQFNPAISGPQQFFLRGESAPRVAEFIVADGTDNPNSSQYEAPDARVTVTPTLTGGLNVGDSGIVDVGEGSSDIMVDTLILGKGLNAFGGGYVVGQFNLGTGTLNANTIQMGVISAASATGAPVTGILNVNGGAVVVNNQLALGVPDTATTLYVADADLNVTNGSVAAASIVAGGSGATTNSEITLDGSSLSLTSPGTVGTVSAPIGSINLVDGATLNLAVGSFPAVVAKSLSGSGTSDTITITALPPVSSTPATFTLVQSLGGPISGYDFKLGGLPTGYTGSIQANGDNSAVQLVITGAPVNTQPVTISTATLSNGDIHLSGAHGTANGTFYVLTSTNLGAPAGSRWTVLSTNSFDGSGNFSVSLPAGGLQQQYFEIKQ